jgi:hypothetical protein
MVLGFGGRGGVEAKVDQEDCAWRLGVLAFGGCGGVEVEIDEDDCVRRSVLGAAVLAIGGNGCDGDCVCVCV